MSAFGDQLGRLARDVSNDYAAGAPDNAALLVKRARRGRAVYTTSIGAATLATGIVLAVGGAAFASNTPAPVVPAGDSLKDETPPQPPAPRAPVVNVAPETKASPSPSETATEQPKAEDKVKSKSEDNSGKGSGEKKSEWSKKKDRKGEYNKDDKDCIEHDGKWTDKDHDEPWWHDEDKDHDKETESSPAPEPTEGGESGEGGEGSTEGSVEG